jgi:GNAT superfamily N-acetyltransferase
MSESGLRDLKAEVAAFLDDPEIGPHIVKHWRRWRAVSFALRPFGETIRLAWLQVDADESRRGWARRFMDKLCRWADERRLVLTLDVHPQGEPRVPFRALDAFYKSCGFVDDHEAGAGALVRLPRAGGPPVSWI